MAISTNGSYFFPLLYAIFSSSCYLQHVHVQSSLTKASWIDPLTINKNHWLTPTLSTDHSKPVAPTVLHFALTSTSTLLLTMKRRQWDPGIPKHTRCPSRLLTHVTWLPFPLQLNLRAVRTKRPRLRRQWDPGIEDGIIASSVSIVLRHRSIPMLLSQPTTTSICFRIQPSHNLINH